MADSTPGFMPTSASLEAFHFLDRLRSERGAVGVLFGPPGTGKSAILRQYVREEESGRTVLLACAPGAGPVQSLQDLVDRLAPEEDLRVHDLRGGLRTACRLLRRHEIRLVVLDQANLAYKPVLETLRELVVRAGASLALAGPEPELRRRLHRVPGLEHRVERLRRLRPLDLEEVDDALSRFPGLRLARAERHDLVRALHRRSGGNWRLLLRLARRCIQESRADYKPRLERGSLLKAFQDTGLEAA